MGTPTPHLALNKPSASELVDVVTALNQNYDKIDAEALDHSTRLSVVEAVAGVSAWDTWTPTLQSDNTAVTINAITAEYFVVGDLVTCDVTCSVNQADSTPNPTTGENSLAISVPLQTKGTFVIGVGEFNYGTTANAGLLHPRIFNSSRVDFVIPSSGTTILDDPAAVTLQNNSVVTLYFQYRTNGTPV